VKRMSTLISDLLTFSRAGSPDAVVHPVWMRSALDRALANLEEEINASGAKLEIGVLPAVLANETHMMQLFQNLLGNAIKYRAERPVEINITATQSGSEWVFCVADNGMGFDLEYVREVFKPFKRLHGHEYPGSGIGLATCQRIVERYGGRIWAESEVGKGSKFSFSFPIVEVRELEGTHAAQ
jgi:light-regulated signal transduction histidine kinase (bacteriophytochrome)